MQEPTQISMQDLSCRTDSTAPSADIVCLASWPGGKIKGLRSIFTWQARRVNLIHLLSCEYLEGKARSSLTSVSLG